MHYAPDSVTLVSWRRHCNIRILCLSPPWAWAFARLVCLYAGRMAKCRRLSVRFGKDIKQETVEQIMASLRSTILVKHRKIRELLLVYAGITSCRHWPTIAQWRLLTTRCMVRLVSAKVCNLRIMSRSYYKFCDIGYCQILILSGNRKRKSLEKFSLWNRNAVKFALAKTRIYAIHVVFICF